MEEHILIAIIAGLLNILFSILIPPLLNKTHIPFTNEIKNHYECNKQYILISTLLTVVLVYISLKVTPYIQSNIFSNLAKLSSVKSYTPTLSETSPVSPTSSQSFSAPTSSQSFSAPTSSQSLSAPISSQSLSVPTSTNTELKVATRVI